ncbi:SagB-type dehydrogenase domain-containing protein [Rhodococcus triatomae BKS 15-14]|nr:SagB-type dehydrogenase domain-containing protein [Rhodococcus triatomae BKS 15-14]
MASLEQYVVVALGDRNLLPDGVYKYRGSHLEPIRTGTVGDAFAACLLQPEFAERFPVAVVLAARLDVVFAKYALRQYRTVHVDAGIQVQNLYLAAEAVGLAGCAVAGYDDERIAAFLDLDDTRIAVIAFVLGERD